MRFFVGLKTREYGIEIRTLRGVEIAPHLDDLARLRIQVFREYPYLYDGALEYEQGYLSNYARSENSVFILAIREERVVGVSTGIPLVEADGEFQCPFEAAGIPLSSVFYFGESVLDRSYRGKGIGGAFMREREQAARGMPGIDWAAFCAVERSAGDPRRPAGYEGHDAFWGRYGFKKNEALRATFHWKEIGEDKESPKTMVFWLKGLRGE